MTLIKSISGIRGTIGGPQGEGLSPVDVVKFSAAFTTLLQSQQHKTKLKIIIGRDARLSGEMVNHLVIGTLIGMGVDVIDLGLSTTPTVEMGVIMHQADGGIIITASHNPKQWNALKMLNHLGEFINDEEGRQVLALAESGQIRYAPVEQLGSYCVDDEMMNKHIAAIMNLPAVDVDAVKKAQFTVAVDSVNSTGGIFVPTLLQALGVKVINVNGDATGHFAHNPEPLPEHLQDLSGAVIANHAHVGFAVDPDVDRLAIICENGECFGEEYTLVAVSDYILKQQSGNTVSNLSSTRALRDVTEAAGATYYATAVGEVNVVKGMKDHQAVIGGEGNGGVIYPELHYGRDALVGIALFLSHLARSGMSCSALRVQYPAYYISKNKIELAPDLHPESLLVQLKEKYKEQPVNDVDGVKIEFDKEWVHLRRSNTEPIIRIYAESSSAEKADALAKKIMDDINGFKK